MAPSNVFSYLHGMRINQRRANPPSFPTASPPQSQSENPFQHQDDHAYPIPPRLSDNDILRSSSPISSLPPTLPPIPRFALRYEGSEAVVEAERRGRISGTSAVHWAEPGPFAPITSQDLRSARPLSSSNPSYRNDESRIPSMEGSTSANQYGSPYTRRTQLRSSTTPVSVGPVQSPAIDLPQSSASRTDQTTPLSRSPQSVLQPAANARSGKAKLNLLNPMSLLARRRTSQLISQFSSESSDGKNPVIPGMRLPEDYDPRIRGKVVHDFSAPRPRRYHSTYENTKLPTEPSAAYTGIPLDLNTARSSSDRISPETNVDRGQSVFGMGDGKRNSGERDHIPVFKEDFGDDVRPWSNDLAALSSERIALTLSNITIAEPNREPPPLPAFARNLPPDVARNTSFGHELAEDSFLAAVPELVPPEVVTQHHGTVSTPATSPSKARSRKTSATDPSFQSGGLPKHLSSTASRFSFDLAGVGSAAQEKHLEEKHKEKTTTRTRGAPGKVTNLGNREENPDDDESENEAYMYDDMIDDIDLEERIPGINADEEDCYNFDDNDGMRESQISSTLKAAVQRPDMTDIARLDTTRVVQGSEGGFAKRNQSPGNVGRHNDMVGDGSLETPTMESTSLMNGCDPPGSNIIHAPTSKEARTSISSGHPSAISLPTLNTDYDDLYYDDGIIAHPHNTDTYRFDESVFDDETSTFYKQLRSTLTASSNSDYSHSASGSPSSPAARDLDGQNGKQITQMHNNHFTDLAQLSGAGSSLSTLGQQDTHIQNGMPGLGRTVGLTQDNLTAYHDALVYATHQATMNGRFDGIQGSARTLPEELQASESPLNSTSHPTAIVEKNKLRFNQDDEIFPLDSFGESTDDFDYDDAMEDDPIIAAANAEALENDDEGFYGREFGFYAASHGAGETQYVHGGYLGPRDLDGLTRSHSGRVNFQEPSLTPITERSEFSNRNSVISLGLYGSSHPVVAGPHSAAAPLPSPGLAQLADLMHLHDDDDLSLSALLKLRRGAWGGSTASLDSSTGSAHSASPVTYAAALGGIGAIYSAAGIAMGSSYSPASSKGNVSVSDDGTSSVPSSPTITLQTQGLGISGPAAQAAAESSPVRRAALKGKGGKHKRNSSGADSVSYIKERNEEGEGGVRWVVEKRRTAPDTGIVEVVGREVVVGGRI